MAEEDRTIAYLARQCGVEQDRLVLALSGRVLADADLVSALERAMGLPEGELLDDREIGDIAGDAAHLRCFTIAEVARRTRTHPDTVRKELRTGRLGYIVLGDRGTRIPYRALEERLSLTTDAKP